MTTVTPSPITSPPITPPPTVAENMQPLMTIVTYFSQDHFMEGIAMLQTLIDVKYTGPIYVYLLHGPSKPLENTMKDNFTEIIRKSPLDETIIYMEVEE
jgi:hypothetical protein